MRRTPGGTHRRSICAVLVALALVGTAGSARAEPADLHPLPSRAAANAFDASSVRVEEVTVSGQSGYAYLCVAARATAPLDKKQRTVTVQEGCSESIDYRFDPVSWTASADGTFVLYKRTVRQRLVSGVWRTTAVDDGQATVTVDLHWLGMGDATVDPELDAPRICYTFPPTPCGGIRVGPVERDARVSGRIDFEAFGRSVPVPEGQAGTLSAG